MSYTTSRRHNHSPTKHTTKGQRRQSASTRRDQGLVAGYSGTYDGLTKNPFMRWVVNDPFPPRVRKQLSYTRTDGVVCDTTSRTYGTEVLFKLNDIYDPFGNASRPFGWNDLSNLYQRYLVDSVDIDVEFSNPSADGLYVAVCLQSANNTLSLAGKDLDDVANFPGMCVAAINNTGSQTTRLQKTVRIAAIEGLTQAQYEGALSQYSASIVASPSFTPYIRIAAASTNGNADSVEYRIQLTFNTKLYQRTQSNSFTP